MPEWAAGSIVGVVVALGGGILKLLLTIKGQMGELVATVRANADAIDDLQNWRLNVEQANALRTINQPRRR